VLMPRRPPVLMPRRPPVLMPRRPPVLMPRRPPVLMPKTMLASALIRFNVTPLADGSLSKKIVELVAAIAEGIPEENIAQQAVNAAKMRLGSALVIGSAPYLLA